ncbi:MAG TPA: ATP-binding protein, partial [Sporichthyaceae bacterium]|nr:ATP-binding protein [Sporichthyaceae bacterium]
GAVTIERSPVRVAPLVHQAVELLEPLAAQRGLRVCAEDLDEHAVVLADPRRLRQVLLNVVSNAIKYNRPDGEVEIIAYVVGAELNIRVRDTGEGIGEELIARLFTPFDRLGAQAGGESGAGLGLVVTQRLVNAMGGGLTVRSRPGAGTTVSLTLPVFDGPAVTPAGALTEGLNDGVQRSCWDASHHPLLPTGPAGGEGESAEDPGGRTPAEPTRQRPVGAQGGGDHQGRDAG